jgi:alpha-tubulin suppressor-like RCC1 family protein
MWFSQPLCRILVLSVLALPATVHATAPAAQREALAGRMRSDTVTFAALSVGGIHTCGIVADGVAYCWGWNSRGQLGDGTSGTERSFPARVVGDLRFAAVSAGDRYTCGVTAAGAAHCWGLNGWGQLGDGTTTERPSPVPVVGGLSFRMVSTGFRHTCAVAASGAAYCWGLNGAGQLGDGTTTDQSSPVPVAGGLTFAAVSAGAFHTCGVTAAGATYCWGANGDGQLGDGTTTSRSSPARVAGDVSLAAVSAGGFHTCGITATGAAYCWGANAEFMLGDGTKTGRLRPVPVAGDVKFASVSAGFLHTCGVTAAGAAYCWGDNSQGQLGDGTTTSRKRPVRVAGDVSFAAVHAGGSGQALGYHTCGVTAAGVAYCWGQNARGQLGDGTTTDRTTPVHVVGAAAVHMVEGEPAYVAAMKYDLRSLLVAEEVFFADSVKYTATIGPGGLTFTVSTGNTLPRITLTHDGWGAVIGNMHTSTTCAMFIGSTPQPPATREGKPECQ